jgi:hypothetical protein
VARRSRSAPGALGGEDLNAQELEVTEVRVLPAGDEPVALAGGAGDLESASTAAGWLPGIRDEHDDDAGWAAGWLDRPTWDHTITPNVIKRTGARPPNRGRRR